MKLFNSDFLGIVWLCLTALHSLPFSKCQLNEKETHRVYSYSYHFQHNGTNPNDILQRIMADPDFNDNSDGKSVVKTIFDPSVRGFFSKGVLPAGRSSWYSDNNRGLARDVGIEDIKKIVNSNLSPLPPPPPLPPIPPPPVADVLPDNFLNVNDPVDILRNRPFISPPGGNEHVVTKIENFARDIPGGRVVGKIESFSYNPPPINNAVTRSEGYARGYRYNEERVNRHQQSTGHKSQSYFRQHFNSNSNANQQNRDSFFGQRMNTNHELPPQSNEWWKSVNGIVQGGGNLDNRVDFKHEVNNVNTAIGLEKSNKHVINTGIRQNRGNIRLNHAFNSNSGREVNPFNKGYQENHNANNAEFQRGINNGRINDGHNAIRDNPVNWDDDNTRWNVRRSNNWGSTIGQNVRISNPLLTNQNNRHVGAQDNDRPFSNGHSGPWTSQRISPFFKNNQAPQNPGEFLKSTLEALINGAKIVELNPFENDGNYRHVDGGGNERVFSSNRVARGPNSFSTSSERGYEKNFETVSNTGFQRSHRWSNSNINRADTSENFNKDFIDVFQESRV